MVFAGILVVRFLDVEQFAIYTIALAGQTTMVILADGGVTQSLLARGGAVATDRARFSQAVQTALSLRAKLEIAVLAAGLPVLVVLLRKYNVDWVTCGLTMGAAAVALHASVQQTVFGTVLFLRLEPTEVQRPALVAAVVRVVATAAAVVTLRSWLVVLWIGSAAALIQTVMTRRAALARLDRDSGTSADDREAMLMAFRNQLLPGIYFALQPQITVWILTAFGTSARVAEVGALGRLAIVFTLLSSAFSSLVLPRFSRYTDPAQVKRRYVLFIGLMAALGTVGVGLAAVFPQLLLFVIGPQYAHLDREVVWVMAAAAVAIVCSTVHLLNTARNWVRGIWLGVPATLAAQVMIASSVDMSTIRGAVLIQASAYAAPFLVNLAIGIRGLAELENDRRERSLDARNA